MSDYEMTVNIFVHLLTTQSSLFSQEDRAELMQLIDEQSDEIQSLSNAISHWLSEHPEVDKALAEFEPKVGEKAPGQKQANHNIPRYELDQKHIINAIQQSSPSAKDVEKPTRNN
jgi:predicted oxidoreductase